MAGTMISSARRLSHSGFPQPYAIGSTATVFFTDEESEAQSLSHTNPVTKWPALTLDLLFET